MPDFLSNNTFWTAVATLASLVLLTDRLLPYAMRKIRGRQVQFTTGDQISILNELGSLQLLLPINMVNSGAIQFSVASIIAILQRQTTSSRIDQSIVSWQLPARSYQSEQGTYLLLGRITVDIGGHWSAPTLFSPHISDDITESLQDLRLEFTRDLTAKLQDPDRGSTLVEVDQNLLTGIREVADAGLSRLRRGEYTLYVAILSDEGDPIAVIRSQFTLFESDIKRLQSVSDDYKYGFGVVLQNPNWGYRTVQKTLRNSSRSEDVVAEYHLLSE